MKAIHFISPGRPPELVDIKTPTPAPGQVLIKIAGAGVCHSDLHILDHDMGFKGPFTLGHENAGYVAALGEGVTGWKEGDPVAVYGPWGCGRCHTCQTSAENYCENHASIPSYGGGLGSDGGMAEYMLVPSPRLLVPLGELDPVEAAPLADAALTPYHAIKAALLLLTPEATVLVVGIGGLGHIPADFEGDDAGARDRSRYRRRQARACAPARCRAYGQYARWRCGGGNDLEDRRCARGDGRARYRRCAADGGSVRARGWSQQPFERDRSRRGRGALRGQQSAQLRGVGALLVRVPS